MIEVTKETTKVEGDIFTIVEELLYLAKCLKGCCKNNFTKTMILAGLKAMEECIKDAEDNSDN